MPRRLLVGNLKAHRESGHLKRRQRIDLYPKTQKDATGSGADAMWASEAPSKNRSLPEYSGKDRLNMLGVIIEIKLLAQLFL